MARWPRADGAALSKLGAVEARPSRTTRQHVAARWCLTNAAPVNMSSPAVIVHPLGSRVNVSARTELIRGSSCVKNAAKQGPSGKSACRKLSQPPSLTRRRKPFFFNGRRRGLAGCTCVGSRAPRPSPARVLYLHGPTVLSIVRARLLVRSCRRGPAVPRPAEPRTSGGVIRPPEGYDESTIKMKTASI